MYRPGWLYPPKFADEEQTRVANLLNLFIWAIILILVINEIGRFLAVPQIDYAFWNRAIFILLALGVRWLMWQGRVYVAGLALCLALWIVLAVYMTRSGGLRSPVFLDLGVTIVMASVVLGRRGMVAFGVICMLTIIVMYFGDVTGRFVSAEPTPNETQLLITTLTAIGSLTIVAAIGAYSIRTALTELRGSKQALREQNEQLQREIAERKQAQEALARLASIVETTVDFVAIADENGKILYVNQAGRKLTGFSEEVAVAKSVILDYHPPEVAKQVIEQALPEAAQSGVWNGETILRTRDGREIPVLQTILAHRDEVGKIAYYSTIMHDLSERKRAEKHNLEYAVEHERFTAFKELLTTISHDLKTPLTILDLNLHLLEKLNDPESQKRKIETIRDQTQRMGKYILDILALSQLEQVPHLTLARLNLTPLLDRLIKELQPAANAKNLTLTLTAAPDLPSVQGDADELARALGNLVENALSYTPTGGCVSVSARKDTDKVEIAVVDTGIGISPEALPHIFERSYRSREARDFHKTGTGFGLAIVQKIIEMHLGRIEVQSTPGKGSTFQVYLPVE